MIVPKKGVVNSLDIKEVQTTTPTGVEKVY